MAVSFLTASESHTGTTGSTSAASFAWHHPLDAAAKGLLVYTFTNANADDATAVSFVGTSLTAVTGGRAVDTSGEPGDCKAWFLGSGVPIAALPTGIWNAAASPGFSTSFTVNSVAYGNGYWVGVGGNGQVRTATDPTGTWTAASSPGFGTNTVYSVAYAGSTWVAGSAGGSIRYATDPTGTWSAASSPGFGSAPIYCVAYGNGYWVAVSDSGNVRYATDPTGTWTAASSPGFGINSIRSVAYGNGYWVAVGDGGTVRYATDPTGTWSAASSPGFGTNPIYSVAYGNGYWVAGGFSGSLRYATDPTGTWSAASSPGFSTATVRSFAYANGYWVAVGDSGNVRYATDPTGTWTAASSGGFSSGMGSVAYGNGYWVGVGSAGQVRYSTAPVTVTRTNNADEMYAVAITVGADYDTETAGVALLEGDGTLAEQSINDGSPGSDSLRFAGINSGLSGIVTNAATPGSNNLSSGANSTWLHDIDYGTRVTGVVRETTAGQGSRSVGFSATTSDDRAAVHLAVREIIPAPSSGFSGWGIPIR